MTDRELLEMAAKAAGVEYDPKQFSQFGLWLVIHGEPSEYQRRYWNPLKDDGDALRLAVKLNMLVDIPGPREPGRSIEVVAGKPKRGYAEAFEHAEPDPCAATRRAIVRAAAEIGKVSK